MTTHTQPTKVNEIVRRDTHSRYAKQVRERTFAAIREITIAQNAPRYYGKDEGFEEAPIEHGVMETLDALDAGTDIEVWVKTATLGGRARIWVRPISPY